MQAANDLNQLIIDDALQQPEPRPDRVRRRRRAADRGQPAARRRHRHRGDRRDDVHVGGQLGVRATPTGCGPATAADRVPDRRTRGRPSAPDGRRLADGSPASTSSTTSSRSTTAATTAARRATSRSAAAPRPPMEYERQHAKLMAALDKLDADIARPHRAREQRGRRAARGHRRRPQRDQRAGHLRLHRHRQHRHRHDQGRHHLQAGDVSPLGAHADHRQQRRPEFNDDLATARRSPSRSSRTSTGEVMTLVVNHLKSKNCGGETGGDVDQGDGQACFNADPHRRRRGARRLGGRPTRPASTTTTSW